MRQARSDGSGQGELFPRSRQTMIVVDENHRLIRLTETIDWTELVGRAESIRQGKVKSPAGRPPHLRTLLGALVLIAIRRMTYREAEDQIRYYAPARYLCALTETDWTPDFTTIQDFAEQMGEDGVRRLNEYVVQVAVDQKLADPSLAVADRTAQEAAVPHPNEMGLMARFFGSVATLGRRAGAAVRGLLKTAAGKFKAAKRKLREYRLGARRRSKAAKGRLVAQMATIADEVCSALGESLAASERWASRLHGHGVDARRKLVALQSTMSKLLPQIRYWLRTGRVAAGKIINLYVPELYAMVRGKVGKTVEFGLSWGLCRLRGGFLLATLARQPSERSDADFALRAVRDLAALFGRPPEAYAYDRAGYSAKNVATLRRFGVRQVGLAPRGACPWPVSGRVRRNLVHERALIEAGIGTLKSSRYGFNRPAARSFERMGACGQRAVLGFNLNKLVRGLAAKSGQVLVG